VSIILLVLFLFQGIGYYGVYLGLQSLSDQSLREKFDSEAYRTDETVTLKVPLTMPYGLHKSGFERVDGELEFQGEFYKLVKQKLERDTLFVVAIKDCQKGKLFRSLVDYVSVSTDSPMAGKALKLMSGISKDFLSSANSVRSLSEGWCMEIHFAIASVHYAAIPFNLYSPPPEVI
jgi:hypothetical protein